MPPVTLPSLPFGQASAKSFDDVRLCGDFLSRLPDAPSQFDAIGPGRDFRIRLRSVPIPDVTLLAGASSPKATSHVSDRLALVIPFGTCATVLHAGSRRYRWASPHQAFFIPAGERPQECSAGVPASPRSTPTRRVRSPCMLLASPGCQ